MKIQWLDKPQKHDYRAAESYLSLSMAPMQAKRAAKALHAAPMSRFAAKDIFRASGLSLLGIRDSHVETDRPQIIREEKLSPLLLYRDKLNARLIIADGYHRVCAVYQFDEDAMIPLQDRLSGRDMAPDLSEPRRASARRRMLHATAAPDFLLAAHEWRRLFSEAWGTSLLVAVAAGADVIGARSGGDIPLAMKVVAPGVMVMAIIYFMGAVGGAHLNPAVTLAFAVRRNFPWARVPGYVAAQCVGGLAASGFLRAMFGNIAHLGATPPGRKPPRRARLTARGSLSS